MRLFLQPLSLLILINLTVPVALASPALTDRPLMKNRSGDFGVRVGVAVREVPSPSEFIGEALSCDRLHEEPCEISFCYCIGKLTDEKYAPIFEDEELRTFYEEACVQKREVCEACRFNDECLVPHGARS